ncbi:helicase [Halobacteriales archaeon QS_8_69_26]|nr:MAG: helicase [Halobacteriales archaeon QS_8_69_26]
MTDPGSTAARSAFEHLGERVRSALSERGFDRPTEPQRLAIPPIAGGEDTLVVAPTGSGKTESAMLPVMDAIVRDAAPDGEGETEDGSGAGKEADETDLRTPFGIAALYVTPLRALNRDMRDRLEWWGDELGLEVDVRHGDTTDYRRRQQAVDPPDVLVTTPETLQAMLTGERLREALADVDHVVIDEIHELAAAKRGAQLTVAMERIRELAGPFQRVGLSATVGRPEEVGAFLTGDRGCTVRSAEAGSDLDLSVVRPEPGEEDERLAAELACDAETASHVRAIRDLVAENESTLVFVNTRQTAEALGSRCKALDLPIGVHHGSLARDARVETEAAFKRGERDALLCTSSMELGIDVGRVDHVVQYRSPRQVTRLLQRVGRAGHRADRTSAGTVVTTSPDDTLEAMVIARRAREGEVEPAAIHEGSLDVVANQVAGLLMGHGELSAMRAYRIVAGAYPYRDLDEAAFKEVVRELSSNRILWLDEGADRLERSGGTRQYVYANLSMIPDEETYDVEDVAGGARVGTLDERFVVNFAETGATFVQRGELWRVVEVDHDDGTVQVSPVEDPGGEVPSWVGQEIPVPWAVAREVGELRRVAAPQLAAGGDPESVARDLAGRYPVDPRTVVPAVERLAEHVESGAPVPTDRRIVVEGEGGAAVVNAALGHRANETLGRVLSSMVGQRAGSSVGMDVDPYRIELDLPAGTSSGDVVEVLRETDPEHVRSIIELSLRRSDALTFRLSQVAEKFGALKSWQGSADLSGDRLRTALEGSPAYDEAVREVFHEDLAIDEAAEVLASLDDGMELATHHGLTPIARGGRSGGRELLAPEGADADVVETVRERIRDDRVRLFCLNCEDWERNTRVRRVPDQPECPTCGATRVAALHPAAEEVFRAVRADEKDADQEKRTRRAHRNASLVQAHGKKAVVAMAARGVGPDTAARIINRFREDEDDFYRDILAREREYARTKAFWD